MVSSWAENSPVATTCRSRGQAVLRAARKAARKYADPASLKNPYAPSSRVNPATVLTQNVIRDAQFWAHQAFHPATHHIIMTRSSRLGEGTAAFSRSLPFPSHITWPHHTSPWLGGDAPSPIHLPRSQHCAILSRDVLPSGSTPFERTRRAHSQASQPTADEQTLSADGQIAHLAPSRCSMTAWAAAKRAIGTRNGEQET